MNRGGRAREILLNVWGSLLLAAYSSELPFHQLARTSQPLALLSAFLYLVPVLVFLALRVGPRRGKLKRLSRWWPALGLGFLSALALLWIWSAVRR